MNPKRHKWGQKIVVSPYKSERECLNGCGIVKVSRHENNSHWIEFWRGLDKIDGSGRRFANLLKSPE